MVTYKNLYKYNKFSNPSFPISLKLGSNLKLPNDNFSHTIGKLSQKISQTNIKN